MVDLLSFLCYVNRSLFCFKVGLGKIAAEDTRAEQLETAQEEDNTDDGGIACHVLAEEDSLDNGEYHEDKGNNTAYNAEERLEESPE